MNFVEISNNIIAEGKKYKDIHPEFLNIFETVFSTYLEIIKSLNTTVNKSSFEIKEQIIKDIFGDFTKNTQISESSDIDHDLFAKLTSDLSKNIKNINKEKLEENSNDILNKYKG